MLALIKRNATDFTIQGAAANNRQFRERLDSAEAIVLLKVLSRTAAAKVIRLVTRDMDVACAHSLRGASAEPPIPSGRRNQQLGHHLRVIL